MIVPLLHIYILYRAVTNFNLTVSTSNGSFSIPRTVSSITLNGRQSKVIVTDYPFGKSSKLLYSTASVFYAGQIGTRDVVFLYGDSDQEHEFALNLQGSRNATTMINGITTSVDSYGVTTFSIVGNVTGLVTVVDSDSQLVLYSDTDTAGTFFAPVIPSRDTEGDSGTFSNYWQFGSNSSVLVGGPYLVRNATISGSQLQLRGDLNESIILTVFAPPEVTSVTWNGEEVEPLSSANSSNGKFIAQLSTSLSTAAIRVPQLTNWKFADSLPEIQSSFSDESWTIANHTTTNIPDKPLYGDGRVLYGCDYGLYVKRHFPTSSLLTSYLAVKT